MHRTLFASISLLAALAGPSTADNNTVFCDHGASLRFDPEQKAVFVTLRGKKPLMLHRIEVGHGEDRNIYVYGQHGDVECGAQNTCVTSEEYFEPRVTKQELIVGAERYRCADDPY